MSTLFDKLGGAAAIDSVIDKFYDYMMEDPVVNYFFKETDMSRQRQRQKQFITMITGGPHNYEGADMKTAHLKFKIGKKEFDATWGHLEKSMKFHSVEP
jgi:hemoglobin